MTIIVSHDQKKLIEELLEEEKMPTDQTTKPCKECGDVGIIINRLAGVLRILECSCALAQRVIPSPEIKSYVGLVWDRGYKVGLAAGRQEGAAEQKEKDADAADEGFIEWQESSCSCHQTPPCWKCTWSPGGAILGAGGGE